MILIKDRHESGSLFIVGTRTNMSGKYDTYKGSTPFIPTTTNTYSYEGNMILIKDRYRDVCCT